MCLGPCGEHWAAFGVPFWNQIRQKSTKNGAKNGPKSIPERPGDTLARPWGAVARSGDLRAAFGLHLGTLLEPCGGHLGPCGTALGACWVRLGPLGEPS